MLELADNWTTTCRAEEYAAFLYDLLVQSFPADWATDSDQMFQVMLQRHVASGAGIRDFYEWQRENEQTRDAATKKMLSATEAAALRDELKKQQDGPSEDARLTKETEDDSVADEARALLKLRKEDAIAKAQEMLRRRKQRNVERVTYLCAIAPAVFALTSAGGRTEAEAHVTEMYHARWVQSREAAAAVSEHVFASATAASQAAATARNETPRLPRVAPPSSAPMGRRRKPM